jgi:hypothetical protein
MQMSLLDTLIKLAGLGAVAAVAVGAVLLLLGPGRRTVAPAELTEGYPAEHFPDLTLARSPALAELAATQGRLLRLYAALPARSAAAVWMQTFLRELRAIMDAAYAAAAVAGLYGNAAPLEALSAEVAQIEAEVAAQVTRRLLAGDDDADGPLAARLAALRLCARELARASELSRG